MSKLSMLLLHAPALADWLSQILIQFSVPSHVVAVAD